MKLNKNEMAEVTEAIDVYGEAVLAVIRRARSIIVERSEEIDEAMGDVQMLAGRYQDWQAARIAEIIEEHDLTEETARAIVFGSLQSFAAGMAAAKK